MYRIMNRCRESGDCLFRDVFAFSKKTPLVKRQVHLHIHVVIPVLWFEDLLGFQKQATDSSSWINLHNDSSRQGFVMVLIVEAFWLYINYSNESIGPTPVAYESYFRAF